MTRFRTIGMLKSWAIDTLLNVNDKYQTTVYTAATIHPSSARSYLSNKFESIDLSSDKLYLPDIKGTKIGIRVLVGGDTVKVVVITWNEMYLYCRRKYKELGLDKKTKHL